MRTFGCLSLAVALAGLAAAAWAEELPEQFRLWGARARPHPYLADPGLADPVAVTAEASAAEKAQGFIFFTRPATVPIRADDVPAAAERTALVAAADCPGQYGPMVMAVLALRGGEFEVEVTDLASDAGSKIGAEHLEVRAVRYAKVPSSRGPEVAPILLERVPKKIVAAGRVQPFWIIYHVPAGAAPGIYRGRARLLVDGQERLAADLRIAVYGFTLAEPDVSLYMYYNCPPVVANQFRAQKDLADQRCHGMTEGTLEVPVTPAGDLVTASLRAWLDLYRRIGFSRPRVHVGLGNRVTCEWLDKPDRSIGMYGPWFRYYPFSEALDRRYVETVGAIRDEARQRGLELILSLADEAGSHPWTIEAAQHYADLLKAQAPDVARELTVGGGWAMGRPEHELWKGRINIWTTNRWLEDRLALVRAADPNAVLQVYNIAGDGSTGGGIQAARSFFGFFAWKAGVAGVAQWTYYHEGTPANNFTWPAEDLEQGHVPTVRWEMVREGAKDLRYIRTLEKRLEGKTGPAAEEARKFLAEIAEAIVLKTDRYDAVSGGRTAALPPGTHDLWRAKIAEFILRLGNP